MEDQFQDLFRIRRNNNKVSAGKLLIAEPFLQGNYFDRSVVYLVEHGEGGSVGYILNKPLDYSTSDLLKELKGIDFPVFLGGPVERNQLYYIHTCPDLPDSFRVGNGIYWGGDFGQLVCFLQEKRISQQEIRFFAGYSGWSKGQLLNELSEDSWLVGDADREMIFSGDDTQLWENAMRKLGGRYKVWANFPKDPILN